MFLQTKDINLRSKIINIVFNHSTFLVIIDIMNIDG